MNIKMHEITVRDLVDGYKDSGIDGVTAYGGRLDVRPPYQREFIYGEKDRNAVIDTVMHEFPLNVMYWVVRDDGGYEVMDGQQRTISLCQFFKGDFSIKDEKSGAVKYFHLLSADEKKRFLDYKLMVYFCNGEESEKLNWFKTINIAGKQLSDQEMRNAIYHGPWVYDAKKWFSKPGAPAANVGGDYLNGVRDRQEYLETAIDWISEGKIDEYMAAHAKDANAEPLWHYFEDVIKWVESVFIHTTARKKYLKGINWGDLHRRFGKQKLDPAKIEERFNKLLLDDDVTSKKGIAPYLLTGDEKHLGLKSFTEAQKQHAYTKQHKKCKMCKKPYPIEELFASRIKEWHDGGTSLDSNCQLLCLKCRNGK